MGGIHVGDQTNKTYEELNQTNITNDEMNKNTEMMNKVTNSIKQAMETANKNSMTAEMKAELKNQISNKQLNTAVIKGAYIAGEINVEQMNKAIDNIEITVSFSEVLQQDMDTETKIIAMDFLQSMQDASQKEEYDKRFQAFLDATQDVRQENSKDDQETDANFTPVGQAFKTLDNVCTAEIGDTTNEATVIQNFINDSSTKTSVNAVFKNIQQYAKELTNRVQNTQEFTARMQNIINNTIEASQTNEFILENSTVTETGKVNVKQVNDAAMQFRQELKTAIESIQKMAAKTEVTSENTVKTAQKEYEDMKDIKIFDSSTTAKQTAEETNKITKKYTSVNMIVVIVAIVVIGGGLVSVLIAIFGKKENVQAMEDAKTKRVQERMKAVQNYTNQYAQTQQMRYTQPRFAQSQQRFAQQQFPAQGQEKFEYQPMTGGSKLNHSFRVYLK